MKTYHAILTISTLIALTACSQPKQEATSDAPVATDTAQHTETDSHAHHHADNAPAHAVEYMEAMQVMHDKMTAAMKHAHPDTAFVAGMIPHHEGAVAMAQIQLKYGKDDELRKLAQAIIDGQQAEIDIMQSWLKDNASLTSDDSSHIQDYEQLSGHDEMMNGIMDENPDIAFVKGMIPHHQSAIEMADIELKYGKDANIKALATQIKNAQTPEIKQMQDWLANTK
ncbi:CopM family metallochaperone [Moraxella sp. ZY200743]|uniref:CopM family metallochaperone n=1 Tax=Moraxella sp. ZY200743 TaxID=2911970 RepID=UPI003D7DA267